MAKKTTKKSKYITRTFTMPDGKRKYVYGKTKAEADAKLAELKAQVEAGVNLGDDTTFGELAKLWIEQYKAPTVRESSLCVFKGQINAHLMPYLATLRVKDITPHIVQTVFTRMVNAKYSATQNVVSMLRDIMSLGVDRGCIAKNPVPSTMRAPRREKRHEKVILPPDIDAAMRFELPALTPERMFYMIAICTGMRRGEVMALRWDCIDLDRGIIYVRRNTVTDENGKNFIAEFLKTADGYRELPIPRPLADEFNTWLEEYGQTANPECTHSNGALFCREDGSCYTPTDVNRVTRRTRAVCSCIDPEFSKQFTPHVLRHTYITRLFEAGLDIKEIQVLAGHADVQITLGTYTHFDKARRQGTTFAAVRALYEDRDDNVVQFPTAKKAASGT